MTIHPALFSSNKSTWGTPDSIYLPLHEEFDFQLDPCANRKNHKCDIWFGPKSPYAKNALTVGWKQLRSFSNPPYGRNMDPWFKKYIKEAKRGSLVVVLVPARTSNKWFHKYIWDKKNHCPRPGREIRFVEGRIKFKGAKTGAPFPSVIVIFRPYLKDVKK